ncbi:MAG: GDSL-type esterase/lipase family protein [Microlunatus sp.]
MTDLLDAVQLGCDVADLVRIRRGHAALVEESARNWFDSHRDLLRALPFVDGDHVVAVGDSITADSLGWFEQLGRALSMDGSAVRMTNLAVSGHSSEGAVEMLDVIAAARPSHVLVMLGTNDVRRHGPQLDTRLCSLPETERNLRSIHRVLSGQVGAAVTLITPTAIDQTALTEDRYPHVAWCQEDLREVARRILELDLPAIGAFDPTVLGRGSRLRLCDGIHPTLDGHRDLLTLIAESLASISTRPHTGRPVA